jgi:hypothetical protein
MDNFLQDKLQKVEDFIAATGDVNLNDANFEIDLFAVYKEKKPYLDKDKYSKNIEVEEITADSIPTESKHDKGEKLEFILIQVPIIDVTDYFNKYFADLFDITKSLFIKKDVLVYKQFAETSITNNAAAIAQINDESTKLFAEFETRLEKFNTEVEEYNVKLANIIALLTDQQRILRDFISNSEDLINPF